jgi:hypothetical protein
MMEAIRKVETNVHCICTADEVVYVYGKSQLSASLQHVTHDSCMHK